MKKALNGRRIAIYLLTLLMVCALLLSTSYARYTQKITGTGSAQIAAVGVDLVNADDTTLDLTAALSGLHPGASISVPFTVTNKSSDVALDYSLSLTTTQNLPVTYTLAGDTKTNGGEFVNSNTTENHPLGTNTARTTTTWRGGVLPNGAVTHSYKITVTWPANTNLTWYMNEIDVVKLTVDAVQQRPAE